jgi:SPP1 family predicted phage head-tail adaptor
MNLSGTPTNPGQMRTSIILQKRTTTSDDGGFMIPAWEDIATVWAKWVNVHGSEVWAAQTAQAAQPATVTIRYRDDVDSTCAVLKGDTRYEIVGSPDDIQERHEYIEMKVQRMAEG